MADLPAQQLKSFRVSIQSLPESTVSNPSQSTTSAAQPLQTRKQLSSFFRRYRRPMCLVLTAVVVLQLLTVTILLSANLVMVNEVKKQIRPQSTNNGISEYLSFLKDNRIPRDEIFTNVSLFHEFLTDDFTRDIQPVSCHSHNDYLRNVPLFDALNAGCSSVEADIWMDPNGNSSLLVGHTVNKLHPVRTLKAMYIDPIIAILDQVNNGTLGSPSGVFSTSPNTTLVLLLDFKAVPGTLWPLVRSHLEPLHERGYLQHWNETSRMLITGPVTVVVSGSIKEDPLLVQSSSTNPHLNIFLDAPLLSLAHTATDSGLYNTSNSYYASTPFNPALGITHFKPSSLTVPKDYDILNSSQLELLRNQTETAQQLGLKTRYWATPDWPIGTRNAVWDVLVVDVGVDVLNVDDVWGAARWDWTECLAGHIGIC